jgi:hypothetical protein
VRITLTHKQRLGTQMPTAADDPWREDWPEVTEGLMNAPTGIALGMAVGLSAWSGLIALVWLLLR